MWILYFVYYFHCPRKQKKLKYFFKSLEFQIDLIVSIKHQQYSDGSKAEAVSFCPNLTF